MWFCKFNMSYRSIGTLGLTLCVAHTLFSIKSAVAQHRSDIVLNTAQAAESSQNDGPPDVPDQRSANDRGLSLEKLDVGDRLRISFYDRTDLTGEYVVRSDGKLSIPLLGMFRVAGKTIDIFEQELNTAYAKNTTRATHIRIDVLTRRRIFVIGFVTKPGAFQFEYGMTVLHAIALGGGLYRPPALASERPTKEALSRYTLRRQQSLDSLKRRLARLSRFVAEKDNVELKGLPPALVKLAGQEEAGGLIEVERRVMDQRVAKHRREISGMERVAVLADDEIAAFTSLHERLQELVRLSKLERDGLRNLERKGLTTRSQIVSLERVTTDYEGRTREVLASIARAKQILAAARRDKALSVLNRSLEIEKEIAKLQETIASLKLQLESAETDLINAQGFVVGKKTVPIVLYEIVRRSPDGHVKLKATQTDVLRPGDVVNVISDRELQKPIAGR